MSERNARIFAVVARIPPGRVATYGQIARLAGYGRLARQVGYALCTLPDDTDLPWHRVINARGEISLPSPQRELQHERLADEGVLPDAGGRISLRQYGWDR